VGEIARLAMARLLAERGPAVLAKGGHDLEPESNEVVDLLVFGKAAETGASASGGPGKAAGTGASASGGPGKAVGTGASASGGPGEAAVERVIRFAAPRLRTRAGHGTGCTLSAAVAARLAAGEELAAAVGGAIEYVRRAMAVAPPLGGGPSPLAHFIRPLGDLP
jgi:hydroxymethylpyrimidine/phosphomethylpyrimidine kinase